MKRESERVRGFKSPAEKELFNPFTGHGDAQADAAAAALLLTTTLADGLGYCVTCFGWKIDIRGQKR